MFQVKVWFQNRRMKWKRTKSGQLAMKRQKELELEQQKQLNQETLKQSAIECHGISKKTQDGIILPGDYERFSSETFEPLSSEGRMLQDFDSQIHGVNDELPDDKSLEMQELIEAAVKLPILAENNMDERNLASNNISEHEFNVNELGVLQDEKPISVCKEVTFQKLFSKNMTIEEMLSGGAVKQITKDIDAIQSQVSHEQQNDNVERPIHYGEESHKNLVQLPTEAQGSFLKQHLNSHQVLSHTVKRTNENDSLHLGHIETSSMGRGELDIVGNAENQKFEGSESLTFSLNAMLADGKSMDNNAPPNNSQTFDFSNFNESSNPINFRLLSSHKNPDFSDTNSIEHQSDESSGLRSSMILLATNTVDGSFSDLRNMNSTDCHSTIQQDLTNSENEEQKFLDSLLESHTQQLQFLDTEVTCDAGGIHDLMSAELEY